MSVKKSGKNKKKYFTPQQANAMLPLLRSILRDVSALAHELRDTQQRFQSGKSQGAGFSREHREELETQFERGRTSMHDYLQELENLGIELKDPFTGLVDFLAVVDGHEAYLCWRMDEPEVANWHDLDKGFAGRQKLMVEVGSN